MYCIFIHPSGVDCREFIMCAPCQRLNDLWLLKIFLASPFPLLIHTLMSVLVTFFYGRVSQPNKLPQVMSAVCIRYPCPYTAIIDQVEGVLCIFFSSGHNLHERSSPCLEFVWVALMMYRDHCLSIRLEWYLLICLASFSSVSCGN